MIKEIFMSYDKWFRYNNFKEQHYGDSTTKMLYNDRWLILLMPIISAIVIAFAVTSLVSAYLN